MKKENNSQYREQLIVDNIHILNEIMKYKAFDKKTQFANFLEIKSNTLSNWFSRNTIDANLILNKIPELNEVWLLTGKGKMLNENKPELTSNARLIEKPFTKMLIKLPVKAQFGLKDSDFPEVYLDQLEKYEIQTEENWHGRYFDIEGQGESMVCDDPKLAIFPGDEIRVREIEWNLYANSKLHIHKYPEFAFFHRKKGICIKHVLEHDVENRRVLLHSYNPDKERYPDEWISLNDCYIVANVVSVTRDRGFNRQLNKLNKTKTL